MKRSDRLETIVSTLLRAGVATSIGLVVLGLILAFVRDPAHGASTAPVDALRHPVPRPVTLASLVAGLRAVEGSAVIALGLVVLIATPILRVAAACIGFAREGDRTYVALTLLVLALLAVALLGGRALG